MSTSPKATSTPVRYLTTLIFAASATAPRALAEPLTKLLPLPTPSSFTRQRAVSTDRIRSQYHAAVLAAGMSASSGGGSVPGGATNTIQLSSASSVVSGEGDDAGSGQLDTSLQLQLLFQYYCRFGRTGRETEVETLDNVMWAKFCRDTPGLLDRRVTPTEADLIFVKVKSKHSRRVDYNQVRLQRRVHGCAPRPTSAHVNSRTPLPSQLAPTCTAVARHACGHCVNKIRRRRGRRLWRRRRRFT